MTKKRFFLLNLFLLIFMVVMQPNLKAQVTIGLIEESETGSLLQLKNVDSAPVGGANADKGLLLPRVNLTDIKQLYPMFPQNYDKNKYDKEHTGLTVYNMNEDLSEGNGKGIYLWDGEKWCPVGAKTSKSQPDIQIDKSEIFLSEVSPTATANLTVYPAKSPWTETKDPLNICTMSITENGVATFTRNPDVFGDRKYTFSLNDTDKSASITVHHLNLQIDKSMIMLGENGEISTSAVKAEGGRAKWFVKEFTTDTFNWAITPENIDGKLHFKLGKAKQLVGSVTGSITIAHVDDPNYTKTLTIEQNKDYVALPAFDYLVIRYNYKKKAGDNDVDLDTATEINGTGEPGYTTIHPNGVISTNQKIENKVVGWGMPSQLVPSPMLINGTKYNALEWADDNKTDGYETVYTNMPLLRDNFLKDLPNREFNIDMYANWFEIKPDPLFPGRTITVTITLYKGGTMKKVNYDYIHYDDEGNISDANELEWVKDDLLVKSQSGTDGWVTYKTKYSPLLRLTYDKEDNTGVLMKMSDIPHNSSEGAQQK